MNKSQEGLIVSILADGPDIHIEGEAPVSDGGTVSLNVYTSAANVQASADGSFAGTFEVEAGGSFSLVIPRIVSEHDRLYDKFTVKSDDKALPGICHVTGMQNIAANRDPYPTAHTIKGLQARWAEDALALGIGHAALNLNQPNIMRSAPGEGITTYEMDGKTYYFDEAYLEKFDETVKAFSDHGIIVYLILLNSPKWAGRTIEPEMEKTLLHPDYDPEGRISAFNVITDEGLAHYKAFVEFVAERYSQPEHGRVYGYIIGNEVDAQWVWCNAGEKTVQEYVWEYAVAVRTAFYAARKKYAHTRVYLSLTHHWTIAHMENPKRCYKGRDVIEHFNRLVQKEGDFDWSIAYHPYPEDLFDAAFWKDETADDTVDTPRITFKNIEVLPRYLSQSHLLYEGRERHLIFSEQGLHSDETEESEQLQAAAYTLAYTKIARTGGIEAFIYHAHVDNRDEFDLNLGLWRRDKESPLGNKPGEHKPIYEAFRDIDGPRAAEVIERAKAFIGEAEWEANLKD